MSYHQHPLGSGFDAHTTASEVLAGQDLTGRFAIVTGGHSGLGLETTRALAAAGANVLVGARDPDTARTVTRDLHGLAVATVDLSDLARCLVPAFGGAGLT